MDFLQLRMAETKAQRVKELQQKIQEIKTGLANPDSAIHDLYSKKSPKRDLLIQWAKYTEELAALGVYKKPITTISSYISSELKAMGLNEAIPYVRVVLPFKYKDPLQHDRAAGDESGVNDSRQNSSIKPRKENKEYIKFLRSAKKVIDKAITKMEKEPFCSMLNRTELREFLLRGNAGVAQLNEILDKRTEVLFSRQHIFIFAFVHATTSNTFAQYVLKVKKFESVTPKQASKIVKGRVTKLQLLFEPKSRIEAINAGFYGMQCSKCGSWRIEFRNIEIEGGRKDVLWCYACSTPNTVKTEKLKTEKVTV